MHHPATLTLFDRHRAWTWLAAALHLLVLPSARAEERSSAWLVSELSWAEHSAAPSSVNALASAVLPAGASVVTLDNSAARVPEEQVARDRGRYQTMQAAGYTVAAITLAMSLATLSMWRTRSDHVDFYGRDSCGPNTYPYIATAAFASGLTVGVVGSMRESALTRTHGSARELGNGWRSTLAGLGVLSAVATLVGSITLASVCSS